MPTQLQIRRGSTTDHNSFTGAAGELTVDTTKDTLRVHDGSTAGGFELARADGSNLNNITSNVIFNASVGIGTSSPSYIIDVAGTGRISNGLYFNNASSGGFIYETNAQPLRLGTSNSERMRIDSAGNVGIGTSSPKTRLDISAGTGSAAGPELTLTNGFGALTTGDRVGAINFYTSDGSNRGPNNSAVIEAQAATSIGHDANLVFKTGVPASEGQDAVETMRINYQGNVGIGTSSPQGPLQVALNSSRNLVVGFDTEGDSRVSLRSIEDVANNLRPIQVEGSEIVLGTAAFDQTVSSEAMRIDSSQNVLVGKSSVNQFTTAGHELHEDGLVVSTRDSGNVVVLNRETNDGSIIQFRKDNAPVGTIGTHTITGSSRLYVGSGDVNLMFRPDIEVIQPASDTGLRDAAISLGNASGRFKDLYLSGGAYLGGSAAANKLDDYEEGTFTPVVEGSTTAGTGTYATRNGQYTKIGNVVHVRIYINMSAHTGAGNLLLTGLPFNAKNQANGFYSASIDFSNGITKTAGRYIFGALRPNTSQIEIQEQNTGSVVTAWNNNVALDVAFQAAITMTYTTA